MPRKSKTLIITADTKETGINDDGFRSHQDKTGLDVTKWFYILAGEFLQMKSCAQGKMKSLLFCFKHEIGLVSLRDGSDQRNSWLFREFDCGLYVQRREKNPYMTEGLLEMVMLKRTVPREEKRSAPGRKSHSLLSGRCFFYIGEHSKCNSLPALLCSQFYHLKILPTPSSPILLQRSP